MQRQRTDSRVAGIRTFPLVTMLGTVAGLLALRFGGWVLGAGLLGLAAVVIIVHLGTPTATAPPDPGTTTEVAMLLMFGLGAYLVVGYTSVAVVLAGTIVMLLHLKPEMHALARKIGDKDFRAIMQFVLITLVILPVLPDQAYGPYQVLNPYKIWLMVVLIVGISLAGYLAYKFLEPRTGNLLGGLLGGVISSTATTVSYARRARETPESSAMAALVIMVASAVVFARVLVLIGITAPQSLSGFIGPIGAMFGSAVLVAGSAWLFTGKTAGTLPEPENPSELKPALFFAGIFALVLLGTAAAKKHFGTEGLYVAGTLSGLTDMDAITLSTVEMVKGNQLSSDVAWRVLLVASLANLVFKAGVVAILGNRRLLGRVAILFGIMFGVGCLILGLWPSGDPGSR